MYRLVYASIYRIYYVQTGIYQYTGPARHREKQAAGGGAHQGARAPQQQEVLYLFHQLFPKVCFIV